MKAIHVVIDTELRRAADVAAGRSKQSRSALIREALREHLRRAAIRELEDRERRGYAQHREDIAEALAWEAEAVFALAPMETDD
ncbi:ribbon-helix-helix protein, CopG family [uncultured Paludibaculum sp.]|uniref:ribbon-helix-helix protein, CopG family n=1 Tax=uncultured Paludibaculum sp. TaxID=1765020 RepID=UPI002AAB63BB|nr:ribbon-helix-helix protein, CopG family [uncultured Paludibaculum sp.]